MENGLEIGAADRVESRVESAVKSALENGEVYRTLVEVSAGPWRCLSPLTGLDRF